MFQTTPEIKAAQQVRIRSRKCLPVGKLDIAQCFSAASSLLMRNAYREKKKEEYFTGCKASPKVSQGQDYVIKMSPICTQVSHCGPPAVSLVP